MIDFFRELGQSAEEKRSELLNAYLDDNLSARERSRLEAQLLQDAALRTELAQMQYVKQQLREIPRRRVPRSFTLDPALYSAPKPQRSQQMYPVLRGATALTALLFVFVLGLSLFNANTAGDAFSTQSVTMAVQEEALLFEAPAEESAAAESALMLPGAAESDAIPESAAEESETLADEPPVGGMGGETAAESVASEELSLEQANPVESVEESARATADDVALKETVTAESVMATEAAVAVEPVAPADVPGAAETVQEQADLSATAQATRATSPYQIIAIALGIATLALGILTVLLGSRSRL